MNTFRKMVANFHAYMAERQNYHSMLRVQFWLLKALTLIIATAEYRLTGYIAGKIVTFMIASYSY